MTLGQLGFFIGSSLLIIIAPGPDILFVLAQGMSRGKKAGFTAAAGLAAGNIIHTTAAALGIAALLAAWPPAFTAVKTAGVLYLLYLAWNAFRRRNDDSPAAAEGNDPNLFIRGFVMNILNPKVALFYLAFFPQFISADTAHPVIQTFLLGLLFMMLVLFVFGSVGFASGAIGGLLSRRPKIRKALNWANIFIFCALAVKLAL
ncbi:MAG: LysE family translocator [Spirochaetales bacterium]|nr:LysE family translocator [Spirochaetales bacterium]